MAAALRYGSLLSRALGSLRTPTIPNSLLSSVPRIQGYGAVQSWLTSRLMQQSRGMKVHSSVKKRCEHCKVSFCQLTSNEPEAITLGLGDSNLTSHAMPRSINSQRILIMLLLRL